MNSLNASDFPMALFDRRGEVTPLCFVPEIIAVLIFSLASMNVALRGCGILPISAVVMRLVPGR